MSVARLPSPLVPLVVLAMAWIGPATGATVVRLGTLDLVDRSQLIFHGTVQSHHVTRAASSDAIVTKVAFRVLDTIKGRPHGTYVELEFLGGTLDGTTLSVSDLTIPPVGEEGIYFVEQFDHPQVHPLLGWWQGHFLVRYDERGRRITTTRDLEPVYDFTPRHALQRDGISGGSADGVINAATPQAPAPLAPEDFMARVRQIAEGRR